MGIEIWNIAVAIIWILKTITTLFHIQTESVGHVPRPIEDHFELAHVPFLSRAPTIIARHGELKVETLVGKSSQSIIDILVQAPQDAMVVIAAKRTIAVEIHWSHLVSLEGGRTLVGLQLQAVNLDHRQCFLTYNCVRGEYHSITKSVLFATVSAMESQGWWAVVRRRAVETAFLPGTVGVRLDNIGNIRRSHLGRARCCWRRRCEAGGGRQIRGWA